MIKKEEDERSEKMRAVSQRKMRLKKNRKLLRHSGVTTARANLLSRVDKILKDKEEWVRKRKVELTKDKIVSEMEGCTFKPKINKKSRKKKRRTVEHLMKWKEEKERRKEEIRLEKVETKKRNLSRKRSIRKRRRSSVKVEDRLLSLHKRKVKKIEKLRKESMQHIRKPPVKKRNRRHTRKNGVSGRVVNSERFLMGKSKKKIQKKIKFKPVDATKRKNLLSEMSKNISPSHRFKSRFDEIVMAKVKKFSKSFLEEKEENRKENYEKGKENCVSDDDDEEKSIEIEVLKDSNIDDSSEESQDEENQGKRFERILDGVGDFSVWKGKE